MTEWLHTTKGECSYTQVLNEIIVMGLRDVSADFHGFPFLTVMADETADIVQTGSKLL